MMAAFTSKRRLYQEEKITARISGKLGPKIRPMTKHSSFGRKKNYHFTGGCIGLIQRTPNSIYMKGEDNPSLTSLFGTIFCHNEYQIIFGGEC
jgi:hypothetical protein